jgi:O-antigen/teichoic acid export membrane protein
MNGREGPFLRALQDREGAFRCLGVTEGSERAEPGDNEEFSRTALKEATLDGVRWVTLGRGVAELVTLAAALTLAHLVPPAEFGRLAVTVVVGELAASLAHESIASTLVQRRSVSRAHLESAALIGLVAGVALFLFTLLVLPLATTPLFGAKTSELFMLFSPAFLLAGIRVVPQAALQRRLDFRRISLIEIAATLVTAASSVSLAFGGLNAEAYIIGNLIGGVLATVLFLAAAPIALPRWHRAELRELLHFGVPAGLSGAAWVGYRNVDYAILGAVLSPALVGFYYRAYTIGVEYEQKISGIVMRMVFPVYSRTSDLAHMRDVRARIVRINATLIFPLLALFVAVAPVLVPFAFGERWEPAVLPAQILAVAGLVAMLNSGTGPLVMAVGRPRVLVVLHTVELVLYALTVALAASAGLTEVCVAVTCFQFVALICSYRFVLTPLVGVTLRRLAGDVAPATVGSCAVLAATMPLTAWVSGAGMPAPVTIAAAGIVGGAVYLALIRQLFPAAWADVMLLAGRVLARRQREPQGPEGPAKLAARPT